MENNFFFWKSEFRKMSEKGLIFFSPSMKKIERLWIKKKVWKRTFIFSPSCWYWLKEWTAPLKKFKLSHDIKYKIQRKDQQWTTEVACLVTFYCTIQQTWDPAQSVSALHQEKKKKKNLKQKNIQCQRNCMIFTNRCITITTYTLCTY